MQGGALVTKGPQNNAVSPLNLKSVRNMGFKDNEKIILCLLTFFLGGVEGRNIKISEQI